MSTPFPAVDPDFNFLCLEDDLIEHLKTEVPELVSVDTVASMDEVDTTNLKTPSVAVAFYGASADEDAPEGAPQEIEQFWALVVIARENNDKSGRRGRGALGPVATKVLRAARSFEVPDGFNGFKLTGPIRPVHKAGLTYIPLVFRTSFVL